MQFTYDGAPVLMGVPAAPSGASGVAEPQGGGGGGPVTLANLWAYTVSGWQKSTASVYTASGWQTVLAAWVYTASGWQKVIG